MRTSLSKSWLKVAVGVGLATTLTVSAQYWTQPVATLSNLVVNVMDPDQPLLTQPHGFNGLWTTVTYQFTSDTDCAIYSPGANWQHLYVQKFESVPVSTNIDGEVTTTNYMLQIYLSDMVANAWRVSLFASVSNNLVDREYTSPVGIGNTTNAPTTETLQDLIGSHGVVSIASYDFVNSAWVPLGPLGVYKEYQNSVASWADTAPWDLANFGLFTRASSTAAWTAGWASWSFQNGNYSNSAGDSGTYIVKRDAPNSLILIANSSVNGATSILYLSFDPWLADYTVGEAAKGTYNMELISGANIQDVIPGDVSVWY